MLSDRGPLCIYSAIRPPPAALPCQLAFTCDSTGQHTGTDRTRCSQYSKDLKGALITMHDERLLFTRAQHQTELKTHCSPLHADMQIAVLSL